MKLNMLQVLNTKFVSIDAKSDELIKLLKAQALHALNAEKHYHRALATLKPLVDQESTKRQIANLSNRAAQCRMLARQEATILYRLVQQAKAIKADSIQAVSRQDALVQYWKPVESSRSFKAEELSNKEAQETIKGKIASLSLEAKTLEKQALNLESTLACDAVIQSARLHTGRAMDTFKREKALLEPLLAEYNHYMSGKDDTIMTKLIRDKKAMLGRAKKAASKLP